jgi:hypothetical protein
MAMGWFAPQLCTKRRRERQKHLHKRTLFESGGLGSSADLPDPDAPSNRKVGGGEPGRTDPTNTT